MKANIKNTINLPKISVERLLEAMRIFESAQDEIENFLILHNKNITNRVKKARREHLDGKVKDFRDLIKRYV